jgi:hypothetical protein
MKNRYKKRLSADTENIGGELFFRLNIEEGLLSSG